ncbi:MAG: 2-dehydropantoate 2-reductase [Chloroflexota bacterium]
MRFLVYGAGAIGGYIGGSLKLAGEDVTFLDRPEPVEMLRQRGITIHDAKYGTRNTKNLQLVTSPQEAFANGSYDCIIVAMKSFDTEAAIRNLPSAISHQPLAILSFQNGIENEPTIASFIGKDNVIAGTVLTAIGVPQFGEIIVEKNRGVGVWSGHALSKQIARALTRAGIHTQLYKNAEAMKWSKMLTNIMANATAAICDLPTSKVLQHAGLYQIEIGALRETLAVMKAKNIPVVGLPRTQTTALAFAVRNLPPALYQPILIRMVGGGRGDKLPSFHLDLKAGRPKTEVSYLNGAIARHAEQVGLSAPINQKLSEILESIVTGKVSWEEYRNRPEKLAREVIGN